MNNRQKRILIEMSQTNGVWRYGGADVDSLIESGYIKMMPHGRVKLTPAGNELAGQLITRAESNRRKANKLGE